MVGSDGEEPEPAPDMGQRREWFVIEINDAYAGGADAARESLMLRLAQSAPRSETLPLTANYVRANLTRRDVALLLEQESKGSMAEQVVIGIWPDFPIHSMIDRSNATIKARAARTAFDAYGRGIVWAVVDSGVDALHPHFQQHETLGGAAASLHRDFTTLTWPPEPGGALTDLNGHGTHVAGILAGAICSGARIRVARHSSLQAQFETVPSAERLSDISYRVDSFNETEPLLIDSGIDTDRLSGVAPESRLVSLKVLDNEGQGASSSAILALRYIREVVNASGLKIHGVNLSLGYEINARAFGAGTSPLCAEVDRLVDTGVIVVAAAGNTGYGEVSARAGLSNASLLSTINDPGNARRAITVGSVHRTDPHIHGVSYFSSKGPTADGRTKPDIVAPGERITSCASGRFAAMVANAYDENLVDGTAYYLDLDGTSMAAPHVSGAIAVFLSHKPEFIGRPDDVRRIFLNSAVDLGRERDFQGAGLLDLARALQME